MRLDKFEIFIFLIVFMIFFGVATQLIIYKAGIEPRLENVTNPGNQLDIDSTSFNLKTSCKLNWEGVRLQKKGNKIFDAICMDFFVFEGQQPGKAVSKEQIEKLLLEVKNYTNCVRIYGMGDNLDYGVEFAHKIGLSTIAGIYLSTDEQANAKEMQLAKTLVDKGCVDILCVGNETIFSGIPEETLIHYIEEAKVFTINSSFPVLIGTAEIIDNFSDNLLKNIDVALLNIHPYWANVLPEQGGQFVIDGLMDLQNKADSTGHVVKCIVGETGYPNLNGIGFFWENMLSLGEDNNVFVCAFMLSDCPWKGKLSGMEIESNWGIFDISPNLIITPKEQLNKIFNK